MNLGLLDDIAEYGELLDSHKEIVRSYEAEEIILYVDQTRACRICDGILDDAPINSSYYKSAKIWFWIINFCGGITFGS